MAEEQKAPTAFGQQVLDSVNEPTPEVFIRPESADLTRPGREPGTQTFAQVAQLRLPANEEEAQRLAALMRQPGARESMGEEAYARRMRSLRTFREQNPKPLEEPVAPEPEAQPQQDRGFSTGSIEGDAVLGVGDIGLTFLTGALAEPVAGIAALVGLFGDEGQAVRNLEAWREAMTFQPRTNNGKRILSGIGSGVQKLDGAASKTSAVLSMGNPYAENAIYTTLTAGSQLGAETLGLKGGAAVRTGAKVAQVQKAAKEMGIKLDEDTLSSSVVDSARRMTPAERDANAPALREALAEAQAAQRAEVAQLRELAVRESQVINSIDDVADFGQAATQALVDEGFDVTSMQTVTSVLDSLVDFVDEVPGSPLGRSGVTAKSNPVAKMGEIDLLQGRIENRLNSIKRDPDVPASADEVAALQSLDRKINDWVDSQYNKDMISGTPEQMAAWKQYNETRQNARDFNADRTISQLLNAEATPTQLNNWIFGASATRPKPQVTATVKRLREVLGDEHPAIKGMQQDFLHRVAGPIFESPPNFDKFVRNYDQLVRERPDVVSSMGLDIDRMKDLRAFSEIAGKIDPKKVNLFGSDLTRAVSQYFVGHGIAKASLRVRAAAGILKLLFGKNKATRNDILQSVTESRFEGPVVPRGSATAGRFIQASVVAEMEEAAKRQDNE